MREGRRSLAFTLTEVLVVIGILAVVSAILFPTFALAKKRSKVEASKSAMRQIGVATLLYAQSSDDALPDGLGANCYSLIHRYGKYCGTFSRQTTPGLPSYWNQVKPLATDYRLLRSDVDAMDPDLSSESGHQATWWQETEFGDQRGSSYEYAAGGPDYAFLRSSDHGTIPILFSLFVEDPSRSKAQQIRYVVSSDLSISRLTSVQLGDRRRRPQP